MYICCVMDARILRCLHFRVGFTVKKKVPRTMVWESKTSYVSGPQFKKKKKKSFWLSEKVPEKVSDIKTSISNIVCIFCRACLCFPSFPIVRRLQIKSASSSSRPEKTQNNLCSSFCSPLPCLLQLLVPNQRNSFISSVGYDGLGLDLSFLGQVKLP